MQLMPSASLALTFYGIIIISLASWQDLSVQGFAVSLGLVWFYIKIKIQKKIL
jgi:hypothetical protein